MSGAKTAARERIDANELLRDIGRITDHLMCGWAPEYLQPGSAAGMDPQDPKTPSLRGMTAGAHYVPVDKDTVARLSQAAAIKLKLLNKVLPDLRAIDMTAVVETQVPLDARELAQRARFLLALSERELGPGRPRSLTPQAIAALPPTLQ